MTARTPLFALALVLLALPLTLGKPGLPPNLKADEAAYLMMASSLAFDRDLRVEVADIDRLFEDFHYLPTSNVVLATTDGWQTVTYGKPWVYSALAAPLVRLFGSNGLVVFNMLLFVGMILAGARVLQERDSAGPAAVFAAGFLLLSNAWAYVFWLQPEIFMGASAFFACLLAMRAGSGSMARPRLGFALAGVVLALGTYHKPMLAAFALPAVVAAWRSRGRVGNTLAWALGFGACLAGVMVVSLQATGTLSAYLGVVRQGVTICEPGRLPLDDVAAVVAPAPVTAEAPPAAVAAPRLATSVATTASPTGGAWSWIFRVPPIEPRAFLASAGSFLWGRHTGMLAYMPFALIAVGLFLGTRRRDPVAWAILAAIVAIGLFTLLFIPFNWHGGGGFVGNRYFVIAYPAFLLLAPRTPRWATLLGFGLGGLFLSTILFAPFGLSVPEPTLQAHVRGWPYRFLPVEVQLRNVPGYHGESTGGTFVLGRREQMVPRGEMFWVEGSSVVELELASEEPRRDLAMWVRSLAPDNRVSIALEGRVHELTLAEGEGRRLDFDASAGRRVDRTGGGTQWWRTLTIETSSGRSRLWQRFFPPRRCEGFAWNASQEENFWVGAEVVLLGRPLDVDTQPFGVHWKRLVVPSPIEPGAKTVGRARLVNASEVAWLGPDRAGGAARVKLVPRWIDADGSSPLWDAPRVELPRTVEPGDEVLVELPLEAPATPGAWHLEVDLVFEHVGWFSQQGVVPQRAAVEVVDAPAPIPDPQ